MKHRLHEGRDFAQCNCSTNRLNVSKYFLERILSNPLNFLGLPHYYHYYKDEVKLHFEKEMVRSKKLMHNR